MGMLFLEIRRKFLHLLWGLFLALLLWQGIVDWRYFAVLTIICMVVLTCYALTRKWHHPLFALFFDLLEREKSKQHTIPGLSSFYYHLAFLILAAFFPRAAAVTGMVVLAVGDTIAFWYGILLGKLPCPWNRKKDMDARFVAAGICMLILLPLLPWWQSLLASLVGMLVESFDYKQDYPLLDDNFLVPLVTALVILLL